MFRYCHIILLTGFLLLSSFVSSGQGFATLQYSTDDGLPSNTVYSIFRDRKGFLWFCTDQGVARYNGVHFERFNTSNGLADNEIFDAREDDYGRIWFFTYNGKLCFYKDGIFHTENNTEYLRTFGNLPHIYRVQKQKDGSVIICFIYSKYFINVNKNSSRFLHGNTSIKGAIEYVFKVNENKYELYTSNNLLITIDSNSRIIGTKHTKKFWSASVNPYQNYVYDQDRIYDLQQGGKFVPVAQNRRHFQNIYCLYKNYTDNTVFIATTTESWINDTIPLFTRSRVTSVITDVAGNYWVSTLKNGVLQLSKNIFSTREFKNVYNDKILFALAKDGSIIYTEQNGSVFKLLPDKKLICLYKYDQKKKSPGFYRRMPIIIDDNFNYFNFGDSTLINISNLFSSHQSLFSSKTYIKDYKDGVYFRNNIYLWKGGLIDRYNKNISIGEKPVKDEKKNS
jgi:ligand-binding sensor domain-containing protein